MEKFYAKHSLLYNDNILCQGCLAVTQGKLAFMLKYFDKIHLCMFCAAKRVYLLIIKGLHSKERRRK